MTSNHLCLQALRSDIANFFFQNPIISPEIIADGIPNVGFFEWDLPKNIEGKHIITMEDDDGPKGEGGRCQGETWNPWTFRTYVGRTVRIPESELSFSKKNLSITSSILSSTLAIAAVLFL